MQLQSTNPAFSPEVLRNGDWWTESRVQTATVSGVINKTGLFGLVFALAGAGGWKATQTLSAVNPSLLWGANIIAIIAVLSTFFFIRGSARAAKWGGFIYSTFQGFLIGGLAFGLTAMLASQGIEPAIGGGLVLQAFVITISILLAMLGLYRAGVLKGGKTFRTVLTVATMGVMITYLLSFGLSFFGAEMPFISMGSAFADPKTAMIGLGLNAAILLLASLWLVLDFKTVEELVQAKAPRDAEWYAAFGLIVTLGWIYLESLKLVFRMSAMMGRD